MKLILFTLLVVTSLFAKDFSVVIDKQFDDALFDITQDYDRDISAIGFSKEFKKSSAKSVAYTSAFDYLSSVSSSYGAKIQLLKIDNNANIKLNKSIKLSNFNKAVAIEKTPTNGYFIGGYTDNGSIIVLKLDASGNILFRKIFGTKNYDKINSIHLMKDGGILAIGSSSTTRSRHDKLFDTGLGLNDIYITRFSRHGQKLWSKKYGTEYDDKGIDAVEANDGSIIVLSSTEYDANRDITLMRITENGDKIWLKHYKEEGRNTPYKVIKLKDGNFLTVLSKKDEVNKEQVRLIKFNLQKRVLIDKEISTAYASVIKDIKEYKDGGLIGVGHIKDSFNTNGLVMMFDDSLGMLTQEHFGKENYDIFNAVTILHNSQAAIAGISTNEDSQESNMWVVKIGRDATISQVSTNAETFHSTLSKILDSEIKAKEIKLKKDLTIEFSQNNLLFNVGKYELTQTQKNFLDKFSKKLIPFLKSNKDSIATLEINGHTSSDWIGTDFTNRYLNNEKLSMNRSYSTLSHIFKSQDKPTQAWLSNILKGSGLSFSKKVIFDSIENKRESRRVAFKIILNAKTKG